MVIQMVVDLQLLEPMAAKEELVMEFILIILKIMFLMFLYLIL